MDTEEKKSNSKPIIIVLILALLGAGGYAYYSFTASEEIEKEKFSMIEKLTKSRDSISLVLNDNSSIKNELLVEQQKITNLIDDLNSSKATIEELNKYKAEVVKLRKQVAVLKNDKMELVQKYEALKNKQDSTVIALEKTSKDVDELKEKNIDMSLMVKKSSRVAFASLKTEPQYKTTSGESKPNNSASKANYLSVEFMIIGNKLTKPIEKKYCVQIIDPKNNVIGNKLSEKFGPMILDYSYSANFNFEETNLEVKSGIALKNPEKGTYFVNIFDREVLVLKSSFTLK
jgi:hypothetical protein